MKKNSMRHARAGFTLIEIMVATAVSLVLVLGVVQIATSSIKAYDNAMSLVSTTAVSRQVLDALESDIQSAILKSDGNVWMECLKTTGAGGVPDPTTTGNFDAGACHTLILFTTPTDRDRFKPGAIGTNRREYQGDVCAVRYRVMNDVPLPQGLASDDRAYCLNRVIVNPEDTFNQVLTKSTDPQGGTLPQILGQITVDSGTPASRSIQKNSPADIFGINVVGITPVFVFKKTDTTKTPAVDYFFYAYPNSPVNTEFFTKNLKEGFGSETSATSFAPLPFDNLKISAGKYAINQQTKPPADNPAWKEGTLSAVIVSITVVDDAGADELRALQRIANNGKIADADWNRIVRQHGRTFVRRINRTGAN